MGLFRTDYLPAAVTPERRITENTIQPLSPDKKPKFCTACGSALVEGKDFCVECGRKINTLYTKTFTLPKKYMRAPDVAEYLNDWLAQNPYIYDIRFEFDILHFSNDFDRKGSATVRGVELSYRISNKPLNFQYGIAFIYRYIATLNFFNQQKYKGEDLVKEWAEKNPHIKVKTYSGGRTTSTDNSYQYYQFVTFYKPIN